MAVHPTSATARLWLLPGTLLTLYIVELDQAATVLAFNAGRFLEGLRAACDLLGFSGLHREDEQLDELLPWSGNV